MLHALLDQINGPPLPNAQETLKHKASHRYEVESRPGHIEKAKTLFTEVKQGFSGSFGFRLLILFNDRLDLSEIFFKGP